MLNKVGGLSFRTSYKKWDYVGKEGVYREREQDRRWKRNENGR